MKKMTAFFVTMLISFTANAAQTANNVCDDQAGANFFSNIRPLLHSERYEDAIEKSEWLQNYTDLMQVKLVGMFELGLKYRCRCANYLLKFQDLKSGTFHLVQVKVSEGKVTRL